MSIEERTSIINSIYREVLKRDPDGGGLQNYLHQLMNGRSAESIRSEIASSVESRRLIIADIYREVLKREPDEGGMQNYLQQLSGGRSAASIKDEISNSIECIERIGSTRISGIYRKIFDTDVDRSTISRYTPLLRDGVINDADLERIFVIKKRIQDQLAPKPASSKAIENGQLLIKD
jgi:hypothetical protein